MKTKNISKLKYIKIQRIYCQFILTHVLVCGLCSLCFSSQANGWCLLNHLQTNHGVRCLARNCRTTSPLAIGRTIDPFFASSISSLASTLYRWSKELTTSKTSQCSVDTHPMSSILSPGPAVRFDICENWISRRRFLTNRNFHFQRH